MTTIVGIAHPETTIAVLAADRQATRQIAESQTPEKYLGNRKLWISQDKMFGFGYSGLFSEETKELTEKMINGEIDIEKIIRTGEFSELKELNYSHMGEKVPDLNSLGSFLLITRYNKRPSLYTCWPLGKVEEREITYIGSGSTRASDYFQALNIISEAKNYQKTNNNGPGNEDVIRVSLEAVRYAQGRDIFSSGLDLIVLTPTQANDHSEQLKDDFERHLKSIQRLYKSTEVKIK